MAFSSVNFSTLAEVNEQNWIFCIFRDTIVTLLHIKYHENGTIRILKIEGYRVDICCENINFSYSMNLSCFEVLREVTVSNS